MTANYSLHGLDILAAPTSNKVEDSSGDEDDDGEEVESVEVDAGRDEDFEETGTDEVAVDEENVVVMKGGGGVEDDGKADGKEAMDEYTSSNLNKTDVAGGGGNTVGDTQDADCEPFEAEDGPSDDKTSEGQEKNENKPDNAGNNEANEKPNNSAPVRKSARKR